MTTADDLVELHVSAAEHRRAKATRRERDQKLRNDFVESASDKRYGGDLGEMMFDKWVRSHTPRYRWLQDIDGKQPDFEIEGMTVEVKTAKYWKPLDESSFAMVNRHRVETPYDWFFFTRWDSHTFRIILTGGILAVEFRRKMRWHDRGTQGTYVVPLSELMDPEAWIELVVKTRIGGPWGADPQPTEARCTSTN